MFKFKNLKFILLGAVVLAVIFLGAEFIPGFFTGGSRSEQTDKPFDQAGETTSPSTTVAVTQPQDNAGGTKSSPASASQSSPAVTTQDQYIVKSVSLLDLDTAVESPHFTIYCHEADEAKAKRLLTISEIDYPALAKLSPQTPKTEILLTYDANEYVNIFTAAPPWGAEAYKDPNSSGGSFCPGCTKSLGDNTEYVYMFRPGNISFAHELAHRYYWASYPNLRKENNLKWLNEGQAVYAQTEVAPGPGGLSSNLSKITNYPLPTSFLALSELQQTGDSVSLERFYDLAGLVAYYIDGKTSGGLYKFIADLDHTRDLEKTCQNIFGFGSSELLEKWQAAVEQTIAENPVDFLAAFKTKVKN